MVNRYGSKGSITDVSVVMRKILSGLLKLISVPSGKAYTTYRAAPSAGCQLSRSAPDVYSVLRAVGGKAGCPPTSERGYRLANGTEVPERTEWHNIVVRRDLVPFVEKWVRKGSSLFVEGKIRTRSYDDQAGVKRYVTEIHADKLEFYSSGARPDAGQTTGQTTQPAASTVQQPVTPVMTVTHR